MSNVLSQPVNPKKKNWKGISKGGAETVILSTIDDRIKTGYAHPQMGSRRDRSSSRRDHD